MKEFEKWFKKTMRPRQNRGENIYKSDCQQTWREALEWAMSLANMGGDIPHDDLRKEVEKE